MKHLLVITVLLFTVTTHARECTTQEQALYKTELQVGLAQLLQWNEGAKVSGTQEQKVDENVTADFEDVHDCLLF